MDKVRRIIITDPAYVKSRQSFTDFILSKQSGLSIAMEVDDNLYSHIVSGSSMDIDWMADNEYYAFGVVGSKKDYYRLGNITTDSGLLCVVDEGMWDREGSQKIDWEEFVSTTLFDGIGSHNSDDYPMFKWYGGTLEANNTVSVFGLVGSNNVYRGLLIRCPEEPEQG